MSSTSSFVTPTSSEAPSDTPTQTSSSSSSPSSTLYLLTFLATLFVLLFISSAIVLRSFFARRRFRRRVDEQIAAGLLPPEAALQLRRHGLIDFGEKPKLWDLAIVPVPDQEYKWDYWDEVEPLAARLLVNTPDDTADSPTDHTEPNASHRNPFARLFSRNRQRPSAGPPSDADTASQISQDVKLPPHDDGAPIQVAVFIQMPAPAPRPRPRSDGGSMPIPEISIGVAQVPLREEGQERTKS